MARRSKRIFLTFFFFVFSLISVRISYSQDKPDIKIPDGPFAQSWDSLVNFKVPDWYLDGKFGIFIHSPKISG